MTKTQDVIEKRDEHFAYGAVLEAVSQGLYPDRKHILREFVQNAYDALSDLRRLQPTAKLEPVEIILSGPSVIIADKGLGMAEQTMRRYRYLGFSSKERGTHAGFRGIGKYSAIGVCDKLIVRSSKLGDAKSYQVTINAAQMFKQLQEQKNVPLENLLREHSDFRESAEDPNNHYTFVELHGIHRDALELLDERVIKPYLIRVAPLPFDPAFAYGTEIRDRLQQVIPGFLEMQVMLNGRLLYKPFLRDHLRPEYRTVFTSDDSTQPVAFAWYCQHAGKGQFREPGGDGTRGHRHPESGLVYRAANFAVGDGNLTRNTLWLTSPERAFYFFGEIHVLDAGVIPTSDRDNFEDTSARGRFYERCRPVATTLNFQADLQSQQQRFGEVVTGGAKLLAETEATLQAGGLPAELKDQKAFQIQKVLEDVTKRLKRSSRSPDQETAVVRRAKQVLQRGEILRRALNNGGDRKYLVVDIANELAMEPKTRAIYEAILSVIREEFRDDPARFERVIRKVHEELRKGIPC